MENLKANIVITKEQAEHLNKFLKANELNWNEFAKRAIFNELKRLDGNIIIKNLAAWLDLIADKLEGIDGQDELEKYVLNDIEESIMAFIECIDNQQPFFIYDKEKKKYHTIYMPPQL